MDEWEVGRRFATALALTVGFYALALAAVVTLLAVAFVPAVTGDANPVVSIGALVLAGTVAFVVLPRGQTFTPPGVQVTSETQPWLVALVEDEARACEATVPERVLVTFDVDASLAERGRTLIVGLPLLYLVTERGLRAVIAHELGYRDGGLEGWVARVRARLARELRRRADEASASRRALRLPLAGYARAFLRVTDPIARRRELAADAFSVRRAGRDVAVSTLRRIRAYASSFEVYWANEVAPILSVGRRPPVGDGFVAFLAAPAVERAAAEQLEHDLAKEGTAARPSMAERIAAVSGLPAGDPDDGPAAATLLEDAPALERAQVIHLFGPRVAELQPVDWDAVGAEVYLERARRLVDTHGALLGTATAGGLDDVVDQLGHFAGALQLREPDLEVEHARDFAGALMADGLLVALHETGWSVEAPPAEPVLCRRGSDRLAPHVVVDQLRDGRLSGAEWRDRARALGIDGLRLLPVT
jgi:Zn-dependent protease with chaperone function